MDNNSSANCKCPDTNYHLSVAVCKGRQRVNYPKCMNCQTGSNNKKPRQNDEINLKLNIFKSYDIRGVYPNEINEDIAKRIGYAFAKFLKEKRPQTKNIVVGRDMRSSSRSLSKSLMNGIVSFGVNVVDIGVVSTEITYFTVGYHGLDASIMVTASHNPAGYNGFKLCREKAIPIASDSGLSDITEIVKSNSPQTSNSVAGKIVEKDVFNDYKDFVLRFANKNLKPLKIVVDAGNGMAGKIIPLVFSSIPCEIIPLYFDLNGNFPNHDANPLIPENIVDLQKKVAETKANFGVAFDGDADRCVFVDETSNVVGGDITTAIIAGELLMGNKGQVVIYDLRSSKAVPEEIKTAGGIPIRERVGHSHIKKAMRENNAIFAGELSGHYYYRDFYFADSGIITLIQIINILNKKNVPMSNLVSSCRRYFSTREINFDVDDKDAKIAKLAEIFSDGKINYTDGITVEYNDWWFNVRKSNTEPILRLNLEATTNKIMEKMKKTVIEAIKQK